MGIRFSHCDAGWSYTGFGNFRRKLAKEIGINLDNMAGFIRNHEGISWKKVNDPIAALLDHSDCDGDLSPEDCAKIAPRLKELISSWPDDDYDKVKALELADGMLCAANSNERLLFR